MVPVSEKPETLRRAVAEGRVVADAAVVATVAAGENPKGDVIAAARIAGIQAAKRTSDLIPLCHPLRLTSVAIHIETDGEDAFRIRAEVEARDRTGVEMEALTAVSIAALTVYDMVKAVCRGASIESVRLVEKSGGRSGHWKSGEP